jgi:hypothetical protein
MSAIHLFGGEKGGVGKSFVCKTAIAYHLDRKIEFVAFDADRSNPDVMRIYGPLTGCEGAVFSEGEKYEDTANSIFNAAMSQRVLVNLPAQSLIPLKAWIEKNELFDLAAESGVEFVNWFVSDCGYDSLKLFGQSLDFFGDRARHIFVANYGMTNELPPRPGIYAVKHRTQGILYIGKSGSVKGRFRGGHKALGWAFMDRMNPEDVRIAAVALAFKWIRLSLQLEQIIIRQLLPPYNERVALED